MDITLKNKRILIVDDEPSILELVHILLRNAGYELKKARDGMEGYETAKSFRPSLIVSDLMMPILDGIQFLKKIRANANLKDVGFILLTGKNSSESTIDGLSEGADDYMPKPFDHGEFLARVKTNLRVSNYQEDIKRKKKELEEAYTKLKAAQSLILQQEKMASIGQLAAGVAHEINNPMGFIMSNLNTLQKYIDRILEFINAQSNAFKDISGRLKSDTDTVIKSVMEKQQSLKLDFILEDISNLIKGSIDGSNRVKKIVQNLKGFARLDEEEYKVADINSGLENTINIMWNELKYKAALKKEYGDIPMVKCNLGQLNQVFMNMLVNAAQAIEKQGEIVVKTWQECSNIYISIFDTGSGIPKEVQNRLFEPFFTTKDVGKGTGLGLSIVFDIIKKHKGEIKVESEVGKGTKFTIKVPIMN